MRHLVQTLLAVIFSVIAAGAQAEQWTVARVTGSGWVQGPNGAVAMVAGMRVPIGSSAETGANTRALLVYGGDSMMVGPGTIVTIPDHPDKGLKATVLQQVGQIALTIEKRSSPHFSVQTPLLAAVVKGTQFTVTVSRGHADVKVNRGLVAVTALASGETANVGPGQSAAVSAKNGKGLQVAGVKSAPQIVQGTPVAAEVTPQVAPAAPPAEVVAAPQKAKDPKAGKEAKKGDDKSKDAKDGKDGDSGESGKGGEGKGGDSKGGGEDKGGEGGGKGK